MFRRRKRVEERRRQATLTWAAEGTDPARRQDQLRDIHELARGVMSLARADHAVGMSEEDALALAFRKMETFERRAGEPTGVGIILAEVAGLLMDKGVLNELGIEEIRKRTPPGSNFAEHPELMVRVAGVRDLSAWP